MYLTTVIRFLFPCYLLTLTACATLQNKTAGQEKKDFEYTTLKPDQSIQDFVGQRICIEGQLATIIHQHMMKGGVNGTPTHVYVDYHKSRQLVAYFKDGVAPPTTAGKSYRFYGIVGRISGAGKGGGTYTEYYLDVVRVV